MALLLNLSFGESLFNFSWQTSDIIIIKDNLPDSQQIMKET